MKAVCKNCKMSVISPVRMGQYVIVAVIGVVSWFLICLISQKTLVYTVVSSEEDTEILTLKENAEKIYATVTCNKEMIEIKNRRCAKRLHYLRDIDRHECFLSYGVFKDADECTLLRYLIHTEKVCEESIGLENDDIRTKLDLLRTGELRKASWTLDMQGILSKLQTCGEVCDWMTQRINLTKQHWNNATEDFFTRKHKRQIYGDRRQLTILLHMGLLSKEVGLDFGRRAFLGGPLGELVQWADLAAALHSLGHEVVLSSSRERLKEILIVEEKQYNYCKKAVATDLIFTDITGLEQMKQVLGSIHHYRCRLRVLDVFGTEPEFNHPRYPPMHTKSQGWGGLGINPKQFFTQFPHTADNSFLGFAVQQPTEWGEVRRDRCLIYGKQAKYLKNIAGTNFLEIVHRHFPDMQATMEEEKTEDGKSHLPEYVTNHGAMDQSSFFALLRSCRILIGLGRPVEGPAPLEAIANGVIFLNPKFSPALRAHDGKPTNRSLTSQHPYAETSIGEPYVYTMNMKSEDGIDNLLAKITNSKLNAPKVPHEFTHFGFLERVNAYIENQDFCNQTIGHEPSSGIIWKEIHSVWPPVSSLIIKKSKVEESCVRTCGRYNMTCERTFFPFINHKIAFEENGFLCSSFIQLNTYGARKCSYDIASLCHAPSFDQTSRSCAMQLDPLLFSCACAPSSTIQRLCPCRRYKKEQSSFCHECE